MSALSVVALAFAAVLVLRVLSFVFERLTNDRRVRELARELDLSRANAEAIAAQAGALTVAMRKLQLPPAITAAVVQKYRIDTTCPNCSCPIEHGQKAFCLKCEFEHEAMRRAEVVRAAVEVVRYGRDGGDLVDRAHRRSDVAWVDLVEVLKTGGFIQ